MLNDANTLRDYLTTATWLEDDDCLESDVVANRISNDLGWDLERYLEAADAIFRNKMISSGMCAAY